MKFRYKWIVLFFDVGLALGGLAFHVTSLVVFGVLSALITASAMLYLHDWRPKRPPPPSGP